MYAAAQLTKPTNEKELQEIRDHIEDHLSKGLLSIPVPRSGWLVETTESVLNEYRQLGWSVVDMGGHFLFSVKALSPI